MVLKWKLELYLCVPAKTRLFVCLAGSVFFGHQGLRNSWNVAVWVSSDGPFLLFAPLIYVSRSSWESLIFHLHHLCFSWPPTTFAPPKPPPSSLGFSFFLVSSWVKGEAAEWRRAVRRGGFAERAHSGHCVRARNNIYRSPLWAPWKQSQYWSPKWTYTAVFIVRSLSIKIRAGEKQLFQHIPWHLSAYWLFCQSFAHLLECLGLKKYKNGSRVNRQRQ